MVAGLDSDCIPAVAVQSASTIADKPDSAASETSVTNGLLRGNLRPGHKRLGSGGKSSGAPGAIPGNIKVERGGKDKPHSEMKTNGHQKSQFGQNTKRQISTQSDYEAPYNKHGQHADRTTKSHKINSEIKLDPVKTPGYRQKAPVVSRRELLEVTRMPIPRQRWLQQTTKLPSLTGPGRRA